MKIEYFSGSNIISLEPKRATAKFPAISLVEAYWEALRDVRTMPARAEVDPRGISEALEFAFILEKIAPGHARIRLAGNHLNELLGMEVRGMPFTSLFLPESRLGIQKTLENVFNAPASARLTLSSDTGFSRPNLEAQIYLAPMKDEKGAPTRILGALQSVGKTGRAPRRFNIASTQMNALTATGKSAETSLTSPTTPKRVAGYDEHVRGFKSEAVKPKANDTAALSHLRLVCNNDA